MCKTEGGGAYLNLSSKGLLSDLSDLSDSFDLYELYDLYMNRMNCMDFVNCKKNSYMNCILYNRINMNFCRIIVSSCSTPAISPELQIF